MNPNLQLMMESKAMYKKCKVVMLPTNVKSKIHLINNSTLAITPELFEGHQKENVRFAYKPQHLYILSDNNRIKMGDYIYQHIIKKVINAPFDIMQDIEVYDDRFSSIIATTDYSLKLEAVQNLHTTLPSIPQSFIDYYVSEYNKGNVISEVMVEWLRSSDGHYDEKDVWHWKELTPKVNPDNTIIIQLIKDSWTREEVISLFYSYFKSQGMPEYQDISFEQWIKSNL